MARRTGSGTRQAPAPARAAASTRTQRGRAAQPIPASSFVHDQEGQTLTVRVPFRITPRGGRKLVIGPTGSESLPTPERIDSAMVKAIARAFRWRKLIETGVYDSVDHIARAENINPSYVSRVIRLTLLAPQIVEAILDGRQSGLELNDLMRPLPTEWPAQLAELR